MAQHGLGHFAAYHHGSNVAEHDVGRSVHAATLLTVVGVVMLWNEGQRGTRPKSLGGLSGQLILGWGVFNLVEGITDHHSLELHHVKDMPVHVPLYDWIVSGSWRRAHYTNRGNYVAARSPNPGR